MFSDKSPLISGATSFFINQEPDPQSVWWFDKLFEDEDKGTFSCLKLTWSQRILFCLGFCGFGMLCIFMSLSFFFLPTRFAMTFTFGNILIFIGTSFLRSIKSQCQSLLNDPSKLISFIIYFASIGITLFSGLYINSTLLTIVSIVIEICSCIWYIASYIPYAQTCLSTTCKGCFRRN
ncbi:hypothetical protein EHI8A_134250 [Entamoeba histolytica HM-1:IMSS-B]|uniref:Vesicle transport protein n=6 Tax=Entamoeba histolytica TaxID=5759 RepID=C4M176_ENTH1|nr:hypothetical protein, conserved [Entamoeba histolytica HM-1:IMSS]EMD48346.1 vesicle transport protein SFT2B, putative [Entamoeba histolytica KU27]EMH73664.1 hypothetical protein EHI8A_134250 [Entamoeba histolytica HM-1:IMSS-B]EMS11593.1 vesicle transport protein SFT2B, putative [Entamoeba histolytica HM-3:IMSS]ENY63221.1 vesicle transport protein SFT2B, putative [Entamoeba histolytica HM-1:IMSS-A]GAT94950.1 hypothetical protein conserved [Entamoeba histolytica]|eukprot:XP_653668.1 hypothetical protein, conserved [Entamoeba histolytica HM-1:IMSS]